MRRFVPTQPAASLAAGTGVGSSSSIPSVPTTSASLATTPSTTTAVPGAITPISKSDVHRITSGQVVLDLQTAVKELVENALDAGATNIEVRFKHYGAESMEVIDNGSGIEAENYEGVALKHHTSKLTSFSDLTSVSTFGFRGEALSSLCALSDVQITTSTPSTAPIGTILHLDHSGKVDPHRQAKCARQRGTTVLVSNLFFSLPVRRSEFEKNLKREFGKAQMLLQAYALVAKGVRWSVYNTPKGGKRQSLLSAKSASGKSYLLDNVSSVFTAKVAATLMPFDIRIEEPERQNIWSGRAKASTMAAAEKRARKRLKLDDENSEMETERGDEMGRDAGEEEDQDAATQDGDRAPNSSFIRIQGVISKPTPGSGRSSSDRSFLYINSRPWDSPKFLRAFNEVYRSFQTSQSPMIVADLRLSGERYDVNVSPDKRTMFLHDETHILERLKIGLEELFAPSRSTFKINGAASSSSSSSLVPLVAASAKARAVAAGPTVMHRVASAEEAEDGEEDGTATASQEAQSPVEPMDEEKDEGMTDDDDSVLHQRMGTTHGTSSPLVDGASSSSQTRPGVSEQHEEDGTLLPTSPLALLSQRKQPVFRQEDDDDEDDELAEQEQDQEREDASQGTSRMQAPARRSSTFIPSASGQSTLTSDAVLDTSQLLASTRSISAASSIISPRSANASAPKPAPLTTSGFSRPRSTKEGHDPRELRNKLAGDLRKWALPGSQVGRLNTEGCGEEEEGEEEEEMDTEALEYREEGLSELDQEGEEITEEGQDEQREGEDGKGDEIEIQNPPSASQPTEPDQDKDSEERRRHLAQLDEGDEEGEDRSSAPRRMETRQDAQAPVAEILNGGGSEEVEVRVRVDMDDVRRFARRVRGTWRMERGGNGTSAVASGSKQGVETLASAAAAAGVGATDTREVERELSRVIKKSDFAEMDVAGQFNLGFIIARRRRRVGSSLEGNAREEERTEEEDGMEGRGKEKEQRMDDLFIIDQHASDEKFNFETLQATTKIRSQPLISARTLELSASDELVAAEHIETLRHNGFEIEVDEEATMGQRVRLLSQPVSDQIVFGVRDLEELLYLLRDINPGSSQAKSVRCSRARAMFASRACRKSVMIGKPLNQRQMAKILANLASIEQPWNCPHGRPTMRHLVDLRRLSTAKTVSRLGSDVGGIRWANLARLD